MDAAIRWFSILGISTICFGIGLFILRIPIRTIMIFFIIGLPLVLLWLYADQKTKDQRKRTDANVEACACPICKHDEAGICLQQKCACCIIMKGSRVIGHSINPLQ